MKRACLHLLLCLLLGAPSPLWAAKPKSKTTSNPQRAPAPSAPAQTQADLGLLDFSQMPFSDQGSHFSLLHRKGEGLCAFEFRSAYAFGSLAAKDHPAKRLFQMRVELEVAAAPARFAKAANTRVSYGPLWIEDEAEDGDIKAEAGLAFPETDALAGAVNFRNRSRASLKVRPVMVLEGGGEFFQTEAAYDSKSGVLTLMLDRSGLVQRKLKEIICLIAGQRKSAATFGLSSQAALVTQTRPQVQKGRFILRLGPADYTALKPGQVLRFPFCLKLGLTEPEAKQPMARLWKRWALPRSQAMSKAKARWSLSLARAPKPAEKRWERLTRAAFACLLMSRYAARGELKADMFSPAKGFKDAFFSDSLPLIALGWSEIDFGAAQSALLELSSFSAAAALPVPPHTGEELLSWEAGGLPLHGLAAWELFLRDPEVASNRPRVFMNALGGRLRAECAWWPPHRDGDGNGLYTFGRNEEKPWYQSLSDTNEVLPSFNLALSALLAWQMQAAAALAESASENEEAKTLLQQSRKTVQALKALSRSSDGRYEQGYDGYLPYLLGLDTDIGSRAVLELLARQALEEQDLPFLEQGVFHPWRAYFWIRCLSLWGYTQAAAKAAERCLNFLADKSFFTAYNQDGRGLSAPGDAATAAAALELAMQRHEQEALLLPDTVSLEGRLIQARTPDGSFYFKRVGLPLDKATYTHLRLAAPSEEPILKAGEFIIQAEASLAASFSSQRPMTILDPLGKEIFKQAKSAQFFLAPNKPYRIKFEKDLN